MAILHAYSQTVADGTATSVVRPSDWNSSHIVQYSLFGNTAGVSTVSGNDVVFQGGANVILSGTSNSIIISADAYNAIAAGGVTAPIDSTVVFSNSNNVSFGLINNTQMTASASFAQSVQTQGVSGISAGTQAATSGQIVFSNSNNISFGLSGSTRLTASYSQTGVGAIAISNSTTYTSGTVVYAPANAITFATNGQTVSIGAPAQTTQTQNVHNVSLGGNTAGVMAQVSSGTMTLVGGNNITLSQNGNAITISAAPAGNISQTGPNIADGNGNTVTSGTVVFSNANGVSFGLNGQTMTASAGGANITYLSYQNRQLGASGSTHYTNGQHWMVPFRVAGGYVSASSLLYIQSLGGTYTSAVAATHGETMRWCIYSNDVSNSTRLDTWSSGSLTWQVWNSGTSSASWAMNGSTSSSAGTGILTQVSGVRNMMVNIGQSIPPGLYVMDMMQSTSSAGYSGLMTRYGIVVDNPMPLSMGNAFGAAVQTSIGYGDAGTWSTTSAAFPASIGLSDIRQHSNLVPYFKMGAI
jgi:hypothetical protein